MSDREARKTSRQPSNDLFRLRFPPRLSDTPGSRDAFDDREGQAIPARSRQLLRQDSSAVSQSYITLYVRHVRLPGRSGNAQTGDPYMAENGTSSMQWHDDVDVLLLIKSLSRLGIVELTVLEGKGGERLAVRRPADATDAAQRTLSGVQPMLMS